MQTRLKTAPATFPVTLAEAKEHLRIESSFTVDDDYIDLLISAATQSAEQFLHRRLITQTWNLYLQNWWCNSYPLYPKMNGLTMPFGQLQSVTSIKYKDQDGDESTWDSDEYIVNTESDPGTIVLGYNEVFPTDTLYPSNPINIEFVCGYGNAADVEDNIKHAIKLIISDLYENRETQIITGGTVSFFELTTVQSLLTPFKIDWF